MQKILLKFIVLNFFLISICTEKRVSTLVPIFRVMPGQKMLNKKNHIIAFADAYAKNKKPNPKNGELKP